MSKRSAATRDAVQLANLRGFAGGIRGALQRHARRVNLAAVAGIFAAAALFIWALPMRELGQLVQHRAAGLGPWGAVVFLAAFVLFGIFSIPVWPMPFIAGAVFGTVRGTVLASASCTITAAVCF
jgi:uncharacterized membrane protein YdjX (TVP38/TMEM64 family)